MPCEFWATLDTSIHLSENTECFQNHFTMILSRIFLKKMLPVPAPSAGIKMVIQKLFSDWWKRLVSVFVLHYLLSAECNAFVSLLQALCISTGPGNATCQCNVGWTGDGKACVSIDNCMLESRGNCHINADCIYIGPGQVWAMLSSLVVDLHFLSCSEMVWDCWR